MELPFTTLDVFTDTPLKGNPLAVVTVPPTIDLSQARKQAIAKEFNLSETVFVHQDPSAERRIDIFTPALELPFAGHPTIGAAVFLQADGVTSLVAKAGRIAVEPLGHGSVRVAIPHHVRLHQRRLAAPSSQRSGSTELDRAEAGAPLFSIVKGMAFALIELPSLAVLAAARIGIMGDMAEELLDEGWRASWVPRRYYYVRLGSEQVDGRTVYKMRTRMIRPDMEDPATGSAACALASYLSLHVLTEDKIGFQITQGVEMGRDSTILVDAEVERVEGERRLKSLHLGGKATPIMSGVLRLGKTAKL